MNSLRHTLFCFVILTLLPGATVAAQPEFRKVLGDVPLSYPRDHGAHPEYATEWWYFTGHLRSAANKTYGFQLTFFRVGISPLKSPASAWAVDSLYLAHFAITDDEGQRFYHEEERSRGAFGEAGASLETLDVHLKSWSARLVGEEIELRATSPELALSLTVKPTKPLTLQGRNGFSQKGANPGDASYYASFTRLAGSGEIRIGTERIAIDSASVWMDQEFSSSKLSREELGWDWLAVQLTNGQELMVYQLRRNDGSISPYSSGTVIGTNGETMHLEHHEFTLETPAQWTSPVSNVTYPSTRRLVIPKFGVDLTITPTVSNQELTTKKSTNVTYWEGRATAKGTQNTETLTGDVYMELVGYQAKNAE